MTASLDVDSYDEDLEWILERLSDRAGATGGLILRLCADDPHLCVLACHRLGEALPATAMQGLCGALRESKTASGVQSLHVDLRDAGGPALRLLTLRFLPAPGVLVVAAICRPEGSFNLLQEYVAGRLEPVLRRYIRLWWLHRTERRRANILERVLDRSDLGLVMLDRRGRVQYCNRTADDVLCQGDALRRVGRNIRPSRETDGARWHQAIQQSIESNLAIDARPTSARLVTLDRPGKRALIVIVAAIERPVIDADDVAAVLYLLDPEGDVAALLAPAFRIYRLTNMEAKLVARLVNGADLRDAAASMNLAVHTARSYLKQVFSKTATNRQAELVRVMCGSAVRASMIGESALL